MASRACFIMERLAGVPDYYRVCKWRKSYRGMGNIRVEAGYLW